MEEFLKSIDNKLTSSGFLKDGNSYTRSVQQYRNAGTIMVNGQSFQQQGQPVTIKMILDIEEYDFEYINDEKIDQTIMLSFKIFENDIGVGNYEMNLYPDEYKFFEDLCQKIFGI